MKTDSRYPNEFGLLPVGKPTLEEAGAFADFAGEMYQRCVQILK